MPFCSFIIQGKQTDLLIDSEASSSSLNTYSYEGPWESSETSIGITGVAILCGRTPPLTVTTLDGTLLGEFSFLIIPECPANLLGRDLLGIFQINIQFSPQGGVDVTSPMVCIVPIDVPPEYMTFHLFQDFETDLMEIPAHFWTEHPTDVGFIDCTPYKATLKPNTSPIYVKQYPLSREKEEGIAPVIQHFLENGVVKLTVSPYNTPINPIPKPKGGCRFTQDLRAINNLIQPIAPVVPDVNSLLTSIPSDAEFFTVIDLSNAYFSIPIDEETQPLFAFCFQKIQMTWVRLPQGFVDSPAVYSRVAQETLPSWTPSCSSTLLQYVDDLLLINTEKEGCQTDSISLMKHLAEAGHSASKSKLQYCQKTVKYLGFLLSQGQRKLSTDRMQAINTLPKPSTKAEMMTFLGMITYCRQWIPDCSHYDSILWAATTQDQPVKLQWTDEMHKSYKILKNLLITSPSLGILNYNQSFHLYCREGGAVMAAVLAQEHGSSMRPTAFLSKMLPIPLQGMPACLRAVAACAIAVESAQNLTLSHHTVLHTTHQVVHVLRNNTTQHMTAQRSSGYEVILTSSANLEIKYSPPNSGPIAFLHAMIIHSEDNTLEEHDCMDIIQQDTTPRPDLLETPILGAEDVFVDGSSTRPDDRTFHTGYAIVQLQVN